MPDLAHHWNYQIFTPAPHGQSLKGKKIVIEIQNHYPGLGS